MKREIFTEKRFEGPEPFKGRLFIHFLIAHVQGLRCRSGKTRARCDVRGLKALKTNASARWPEICA